jgi:hypothetical protein
MQRQHMLDRVFESEEKSQLKREYRQQTRIAKELEIEQSLQRAQEEKLQKQRAMEQEERLAVELERFKLEQLRDAKMRQQLRATSYELRELETKLRDAYVTKERHAQVKY